MKEKYDILRSHIPVNTIKEYYNYIFSDSLKVKLNSILTRFSINSSQESLEKTWNRLINDEKMINHFGKYKKDGLYWLYGQFNKQAIFEHKKWHIIVNDMDEKLIAYSNILKRKKIPFPFVSKKDLSFDIQECKFQFIDELKQIELKEMVISTAVSDYLRAQNSRIKLIYQHADILSDVLENYDETILDRLISKKQEHAENISDNHTNNISLYNFSRKLFHDCINQIETIDIPNIGDTQKYYQNGRIHHNVDERNFSWVFNEGDI